MELKTGFVRGLGGKQVELTVCQGSFLGTTLILKANTVTEQLGRPASSLCWAKEPLVPGLTF